MEKYESKQVQILRPASMVYTAVSDFSNFTPVVQDKVEGWQADSDSCSFKVKGFTLKLKVVEREENQMVKIEAEGGSPMDFILWVQLKQTNDNDTRMRLVVHAELNMMMKMMVGGKIKGALDKIVDQVATAFNAAPIQQP